jgi:hypothetical protein
MLSMGDGLDAADLLEDAVAETGLHDVGDEWFLAPLEAWATDLRQDNLTELGRRLFRSQAVRDLSRRLQVLDALKADPEIDAVEIPPIVHITGMERSGTTLLHNLLALSPRTRSLPRWQLMEPVPPPDAATAPHDPRIAQVQAAVDRLRGSLLERMHWVNADEPEECVWGFIDCVSFLGQAASAAMPTWGEFLRSADQTRSYENYRRVVQLLTWRHPVPEGGVLVLKAPQIAAHIAEFAAVFPEARFVVPDRDPYRCIVSTAVMVRSILDPLTVENPIARGDAGDHHLLVDAAAAKFDAITELERRQPGRVTHVPYPTLVEEPIEAVTAIEQAFGLPTDGETAARIDEFLTAQRAGRRAAPPATLDTLGFDHDRVLAEPSISAYCARHGIAPETVRLTG